MSVLNIIDVTENKVRPSDLEGTGLLVITGITESTLNDAISLAKSAREEGIVTAGILSHSIPQESGDFQEFRKYADAVIFSRCKAERVSRRIAERISDNGNESDFMTLDIEDITEFLRNAGTVHFGEGRAKSCIGAAKNAAEMLGDIQAAKYVLLNITTSDNIESAEIHDAVRIVEDICTESTRVIWGHVIDEDMGNSASVSVFAAMNDVGYRSYTDLLAYESPENIEAIIESGPDERTLLRLGTMEKFFEAAIRLGRAEIIKSLMQHGYDPKALEREGSFPADILEDALCKGSAEEVIQLLLDAGITLPEDFVCRFFPRITPAILKSLINHGWNVNSRNRDGETALMNIVKGRNYDCVKILIEAGAEVNARDNDFMTPLMHLEFGYMDKCDDMPEIIRLLLENGADINAVDNEGRSFLEIMLETINYMRFSKTRFMKEILPMMLNAGADTSLLPFHRRGLHEPEPEQHNDEKYEAFRSNWRDILRKGQARSYRKLYRNTVGRLFREAVNNYDAETVKELLEFFTHNFDMGKDLHLPLRINDFPEADTEPSEEKSEIKRKLDAGSEILKAISSRWVNVPLLSPKGRELTYIPEEPFMSRTTLEFHDSDFKELCMSYSPEALRRAISSGISPNTGRGAGLNPLRVIAEEYKQYYDAAGMFDVLLSEGCNAGCLSSTWVGECLRQRGRLLMLRDIRQVKMMIQIFVHGKEDEVAGLRLKKPRTKERGRYDGWVEMFGDLSCLNMLSHMWNLIE